VYEKRVSSVIGTNRCQPNQSRKKPLILLDSADSPFSVCPLVLQILAVALRATLRNL